MTTALEILRLFVIIKSSSMLLCVIYQKAFSYNQNLILDNSEVYITYGLEDYWFPIIQKWLSSEDQYLSDACLKYKKVFEKAIQLESLVKEWLARD